MEKEEIPSGNKNDPPKKEKSTVLPVGPGIKAINEEREPDNPTDKPRNNRIDKFTKWFKKKKNQRSILLWVNIGMLLAFIGFGGYQAIKTKESLDTIASTNKLDLSAYICFDDITQNPPVVGQKFIQRTTIINSGKTPAYHVRVKMEIKTGTGVYPKEWNKLVEMQKREPEMGAVGAGQKRGVGVTTDSAVRIIDSINIYSGTLRLFVFGFATYKDGFGADRFTECCLVWDIESDQFMVYGEHNNAN